MVFMDLFSDKAEPNKVGIAESSHYWTVYFLQKKKAQGLTPIFSHMIQSLDLNEMMSPKDLSVAAF